jgi:hypothetical protein
MTQPEQPAQPETLVFFMKTNKNFHQGGFVLFSREEFDTSKAFLENEVDHLLKSEKTKDPSVELESWGVLSSLTGEVVESFTGYGTDPTREGAV